MFGKDLPIKEIKRFTLQRKIAAHKTLEAWQDVPHAGVIIELDVTNVLDFIKKIQKKPKYSDVKVTINSVMLKIIAESIKKCPDLNSHVQYNQKSNSGRIIVYEDINIALPMIVPDGRTITPVVPQVNNKSIKEICEEMINIQKKLKNTNIDYLLFEAGYQDTIEKLKHGHLGVLRRIIKNAIGKDKIKIPKRKELKEYDKIPDDEKLTAQDLLSATILVSNIGPAFKDLPCYIGMLEIIPPQMTVIGLAPVRKQPVAVEKENGEYSVEVRDILPYTVYCDHRGMDFAPAVPTLREMLRLCKNPELLLEKDEG
ncbi:MAG: hypothetical protein GF364_14285 [Candidatus Lokiarchaeota archaeon]|nr:hypothetical protein [Candidatus Lokiarchaeota archaeon]